MSAPAVWLRFFRLRLLPTALLNGLTGAVAAGAVAEPLPVAEAVLAATVITALYLVGMGLNDLADRERDRIRAPGRPIPSGALPVRRAAAAVLVAGVVAAAAAALLPAATRPWSAAAFLAILAYDLALKDHPWLGPLAMGSVRSLVTLFGASLAGAPLDGLVPALVLGGHGFWTTRYSLEEESARPDVLRRRATTLLVHAALSAAVVAAVVAPRPLLLLGWVAPLLALLALLGKRATIPPARVTFLALLALPLLDAALQLSYDSSVTAAACILVLLAIAPRPAAPSRDGKSPP